jgi:hypothetical protein
MDGGALWRNGRDGKVLRCGAGEINTARAREADEIAHGHPPRMAEADEGPTAVGECVAGDATNKDTAEGAVDDGAFEDARGRVGRESGRVNMNGQCKNVRGREKKWASPPPPSLFRARVGI